MDIDLIVLSAMFPKKFSPYSGTFVYEQVKALRSLIKGEITVIVPVPWSPRLLWFKKKWKEYGGMKREEVIDNIKIYYKKCIVIPGQIFFPFQGLSRYLSVKSVVKKLIKSNERLTIIHSHSILPSGLAGVLLAKKFKIPHICTVHGSDINIYPFYSRLSFALTKYVLKKCDHIVAVSNKLREKILSIEEGLNNISVIHNGADSRKFFPMPKSTAKHRLGINENGKIILFVGNLKPVKGVNYLIEAFAQLQQIYKRTESALYLIGDGSERKNLESLARKVNVAKKVIFLGRKHHAEIPLWLNIADIFTLPSVSEGFPTVIPEAMMCGVPVVATDVGGISEAVINKHTGILVKSRDANALAEAINSYLSDEQFTQNVIRNARKMADKFTWLESAEKMIEIYKATVSVNK